MCKEGAINALSDDRMLRAFHLFGHEGEGLEGANPVGVSNFEIYQAL